MDGLLWRLSRKAAGLILVVMLITPALLATSDASAAPAGFRLPFVGDASWLIGSDLHKNASAQAVDYTLPTYQTSTPWNRNVVASAAGRVVYKAFQKNTSSTKCPYNSGRIGFGNLVILYHPSTGHYSYYAHLASFATDLPAAGSMATVPQGTVIGVMGNTGCSSGPHLHFEIRTGVSNSNLIGSGTSQYIKDLPGMNQKGNGTATGPGSAGVTCSAQQYTASIYNNTSFSGTPVTQCHNQPLDVNWGAGSPAAGVGIDNFTVRWTRTANVAAGTYSVFVRSDDGIRVWINGGLMIDQWSSPPFNGATYSWQWGGGTWDIKIEYVEYSGNAYAKFHWTQQTAPPVTCSSSQYTGAIYNNTSFSGTPVTQCFSQPLNVNWGSGSPAAGVGSDNYTVRWSGRASFNAGKYDFYVRSDDGIRVWVNNALIINQWDNPPYDGMNYRNYTMAAGTWDIKIEYIERGGNAYAQFSWTQQQASGSPPAAPSNVQASNISPGVVRLAWKDNANNETGFRVWDGARYWTFGAASGSGGGWYADLNGGWPSGTWKCFQMQAYNTYGSSDWVGMSCLYTK